jgi:hypothetical protein
MAENNTGLKPAAVRSVDGRFQPGHNMPGPGRPRFLENERERFAAECRYEIRRRKIAPEQMAAMAVGEGKYAKLSPLHRHQIAMDLLAYAFGKPITVQINGNTSNSTVTVTKRIIGVPDDAV